MTDLAVGDFVVLAGPFARIETRVQVDRHFARVFGKEAAKAVEEALAKISFSELESCRGWKILHILSYPKSSTKHLVARPPDFDMCDPQIIDASQVALLHRPKFKEGDRVQIVDASSLELLNDGSAGTVHSVSFKRYEVKFDILDYILMIQENNLDVYTDSQKPEEPPMPDDRSPASFKLSTYTAKSGRWRPSANLFQLVASKLGELKSRPDWIIEEDGAFGNGTAKVAESIQKTYSLSPVDGEVGRGTWNAITPDLGTWRPPLRLRIAECQCSWEAGSHGYGFTGLIPYEGWWNWGIWNVNKGSAKALTSIGGASHLHARIDAADAAGSNGRAIAEEVASWFNSKVGRITQVGSYFLTYTIKPSIHNLVKAGWPIERLGFSSLAELDAITEIEDVDAKLADVSPFIERLILHACDITVNSGAGGYFPKKSPRQWDKVTSGNLPWPEEKLPFKQECQEVFAHAFGCTIDSDRTYCTSDTRDTYRDALSTCLWQVCQTDEQRLILSAELQARCVIDQWREAVIGRRRAAAWKEGHSFQGSDFCMLTDFGIGI